jgi:hypothetical protein
MARVLKPGKVVLENRRVLISSMVLDYCGVGPA